MVNNEVVEVLTDLDSIKKHLNDVKRQLFIQEENLGKAETKKNMFECEANKFRKEVEYLKQLLEETKKEKSDLDSAMEAVRKQKHEVETEAQKIKKEAEDIDLQIKKNLAEASKILDENKREQALIKEELSKLNEDKAKYVEDKEKFDKFVTELNQCLTSNRAL